MEAASCASSATSAAAETTTPRGCPVDPEVSLIAPIDSGEVPHDRAEPGDEGPMLAPARPGLGEREATGDVEARQDPLQRMRRHRQVAQHRHQAAATQGEVSDQEAGAVRGHQADQPPRDEPVLVEPSGELAGLAVHLGDGREARGGGHQRTLRLVGMEAVEGGENGIAKHRHEYTCPPVGLAASRFFGGPPDYP